jgi:hypothetical protein
MKMMIEKAMKLMAKKTMVVRVGTIGLGVKIGSARYQSARPEIAVRITQAANQPTDCLTPMQRMAPIGASSAQINTPLLEMMSLLHCATKGRNRNSPSWLTRK